MSVHGFEDASVLVLEDQSFLARQVVRELYQLGLKPDHAENLEQARKLIEKDELNVFQ